MPLSTSSGIFSSTSRCQYKSLLPLGPVCRTSVTSSATVLVPLSPSPSPTPSPSTTSPTSTKSPQPTYTDSDSSAVMNFSKGYPREPTVTATGPRGRVAPMHCCIGAPSDPCVPLVAAYGSSKPRRAFQA
jgi:hypothetical protein